MTTPYFLQDLDGNIRFTPYGIQELRPYFSKAGINITDIKTYDDYLAARDRASPYFMAWLEDRTKQWTDHSEYQLLKNALFGDIKERDSNEPHNNLQNSDE